MQSQIRKATPTLRLRQVEMRMENKQFLNDVTEKTALISSLRKDCFGSQK